MNKDLLKGKKVAILVTDGVEELELTSPKEALQTYGAEAEIVSPNKKTIRAWNKSEWSKEYAVDRTLDEANPREYSALLLPGGVINPDKLRQNATAVRFVKAFFDAGKPVAAICHGPQLLIEADVLHGRTLTSYPSIRSDLQNAGARWIDKEVVVDQGLVTSRSPSDLKAFNQKMVEEIGEGVHKQQRITAPTS